MKRIISLTLLLVLMTGLSACGAAEPRGTTPTAQPTIAAIDPQQMVEKAKKELEEHEGNINIYLVTIDELLQLPENAAADAEVASFLLEVATETYQLIEKEMEGIYNADKIAGYMEHLMSITKFPGDALNAHQAKEKTDLILKVGTYFLERSMYGEAMAYWKKCNDPTVNVILEAVGLFEQGKNVQAVEFMRENLENGADYEFFAFSLGGSTASEHIQDVLDYRKAYTMIRGTESDPERTWVGEVFEYWKATTQKTPGGMSAEDIQYLKENAGKEAASKVLILERNRAFEQETPDVYISDKYWYLPDELVPKSVEEVEYILLLDVDYEDTGRKFDVGTVLIKEIACVYVYSVHEQKPIYQSVTKETPILPVVNLMYNGEPPAFYSPSHPDMAEYAGEALHLILDKINK